MKLSPQMISPWLIAREILSVEPTKRGTAVVHFESAALGWSLDDFSRLILTPALDALEGEYTDRQSMPEDGYAVVRNGAEAFCWIVPSNRPEGGLMMQIGYREQ